MTKIRPEISPKKEFYISKHAFYAAYHFALQYPEWKQQYTKLIEGTIRAVDYNDSPHGTGTGDPTPITAMRMGVLRGNVEMIESTAILAGRDVAEFLLYAVTNEGITYNYLRSGRCSLGVIPCGRNQYYQIRRSFYYLLSKKLEERNS